MTMDTPIDIFYREQKEVRSFLESHQELSHLAVVIRLQQKSLLLATASYFENRIQEMMVKFVNKRAAGDEMVVSILKKKAIDRQYHTYFNWDGNNANQFFTLFGSTFADKCKKEISKSQSLKNSVAAFLELGNKRNELVHLNFVSFSLDLTADEIYEKYRCALEFVSWLENELCPDCEC